MAQQSSKIRHTWGTFSSQKAAEETREKLKAAGIDPKQITLETSNIKPPVRVEETQAAESAKTGAIAGAVLGVLVGFGIGLIKNNVPGVGLVIFDRFHPVFLVAPIIGGVIGAVGMSSIAALTGRNVPKPANESIQDKKAIEQYLVAIEATPEQARKAQEIIRQQGGLVEEENRI